MKLQKTKLGFTLIELLVVITIIGILATGAVSVYTSQIQKARDSTRLTDVTAVKAWIEQVYQDYSEYPSTLLSDTINFKNILIFTPKLPQDPKKWQARAGSAFDYSYTVWDDTNSITNQDFEISTTFENQWNIDSKAVWDGWEDNLRLEIWIDLLWWTTWSWNTTTMTKWITTWSLYQCVAKDSVSAADCDGTAGEIMLIRKQ